MSIKSQTNNMRRLAALLNFNLCNIRGKKECGPNGSKQVFLNVGKVFLRALARDLGLHDVTVSSNAGGIGVSGDCNLIGMWENGGLYKRDGEKETDFIDVVAWRSTAEFVSRYFAKGRMAVVEGRLQIRDWTDKEGGKRRSAEVIADNVYFGDSKPKEDGAPSADADFGAPPSGFTPDFGDDGEMPF